MPDRRGFFKVTSHERQVVGALGSIGLATLASRVLGFVRDMVVALVFGAGPVTDAFFVAFRIPNILRRLLAEGALSTAVIPVFTEYAMNRPRDELIRILDPLVPSGSGLGQSECRSSMNLENFKPFDDTCNHVHIDFGNANAPTLARG